MTTIGAEIVKEIFGGNELTMKRGELSSCILNKWHPKKKSVEVPIEAVSYLINANMLELDSGNFETGEEHYTYKQSYVGIHTHIFELLKPVLREVRLNKLLK
jgi:hypothetical protein